MCSLNSDAFCLASGVHHSILRQSGGGTTDRFHQTVWAVAAHTSWHGRHRPTNTAGPRALDPLCRPRFAGSGPADPGLFFQPVELHLQLADLALEPFRLPVWSKFGATFAFKQPLGLPLNFLLPLPDRHRMDTVFLTDLVGRSYPSQGLQPNLRFELRCVDLPLLRFPHSRSFLMMAHSLNYCLENGVHYTSRH